MVDCTGLENRRPARAREFESHRFRQSVRVPRVQALHHVGTGAIRRAVSPAGKDLTLTHRGSQSARNARLPAGSSEIWRQKADVEDQALEARTPSLVRGSAASAAVHPMY